MKKILVVIALILPMFFIVGTNVSAQGIAQLSGCTGVDCSACNIVDLANGGITWLIGILFVVFALLLAIAGVKLVTSGGNHHALDEAKSSFMNAIIGFIIILSAWLIVDTIMRGLVGRPGQEGMIGGEVSGWLFWSEIECQDQIDPRSVEVTQEDVVLIPVERDLANVAGWTIVNTGGAGGGGGDAGQAGAAGITRTSQCARQPGPAAEAGFDCRTRTAECTAGGGRVTIIQSGSMVSCFTPAGAGGGGGVGGVGGGAPLITQPSGQLCFPSGACFTAVTGIAGQQNYQYPSGYAYIPNRWIDTQNPGPGVSMNTRVSANYTLRELNVSGTCGSGGRYMYVDPNALARMEAVNTAVGRKLSLNSVHRSPGCNTRVDGATRSYHMSGKAFDMQPAGISKSALMQICRNQGARYVSDYESTSHVHCDWGGR